MAKRKKSLIFYIKEMFIYLFRILALILKGIYHALSGIGHGISWIVNKIKSRKNTAKTEDIKEESKTVIQDKSSAKYESFKEIKNLNGLFEEFENELMSSGSLIGIILGARGTGKSAIGLKLLENIKYKTARSVCVMGFKSSSLPSWISPVANVEDIPNNSVVLLDEAGIEFSSRDSMSLINKILSNLLLISRHRDLSIIFISQNSSNLDLNILRQSDFLIMKPSSLMQKDFERKKIKTIYEEVNSYFKEFHNERGLAYIYSHKYRGFITNPLPSFWNAKISKSYSNFKEEN